MGGNTPQPLMLITPEMQSQVATMHSQLQGEIDKIKSYSTTDYKTGGQFSFATNRGAAGNTSGIDVHGQKDVTILIQIAGFVTAKEKEYTEGAEALGLGQYPTFKWNGHTAADWCHDCKLRVNILNSEDRKKVIESNMNKLEKYFSAEQQLNTLLTDINAMFQPSIS